MALVERPTGLSRRRFLLGAPAAGLALAAQPGRVAWSQSATAALTDAAWRDLAKAIEGPIFRAADFGFAKVSRPQNPAYENIKPAGIAYCTSAKDISAALRWCRGNAVPMVPRSGGHSYGGYSTIDQGLIIDVSLMSQAGYDPETGRITVEAGVRNGPLCKMLRDAGAAITHGRCSTVGIAGYLLGGGIGFNMRTRGVAVDQLVSTQLIAADGTAAVASDRENSELFWACRGGGGGNFGINTNFVLDTFPATSVVVFKVQWTYRTPEPQRVAYELLRSFTDADDGVGSRLALLAKRPDGKPDDVAIDLIGQYHGTGVDKVMSLLAPATNVAKPQSEPKIEMLSYWEAQAALDVPPYPPGPFHERSSFLSGALDQTALDDAYAKYLLTWPGTTATADLRFFQTGGQMNRPRGSTAFIHRDSQWLMVVGLGWIDADPPELVRENIAWQNRFYASMQRYGGGMAYQNFIDPAEQNWADAYYGEALPRLRKVKRDVDPNWMFKFAQGIPPAV